VRWSKIKNIIILLLAMVNVCLLGLTGVRCWSAGWNDRELRARMVTVLGRSNIAFAPAEVPGEMPLEQQQVSVAVPGADLARALVGDIAQTDREGTWTTYQGTQGSAAFSAAGEVEVLFAPGVRPVRDDPVRLGEELLEELGIQALELERHTRSGEETVRWVQLWQDAPVAQAVLTLTCRNGAAESFSGRMLSGGQAQAYGGELLSASTALSRFLEGLKRGGYACSQIREMRAGYVMTGGETVTLTPAWLLETDTDPWYFAVNAADAAVTVLEPEA